jgi:soluble lytic murein transglycosylase-like protein
MTHRDRRVGDRRATDRGTRDRRRSVRRRAQLRSVVLTAMAVSAPAPLPHGQLTFRFPPRAQEARVSTSIDPVVAVPPSQAYNGLIHEAAVLYRISPTLIHAVMQAESAFDPMAISRAGAMGLMQLMPETAGAFEIADPFDPRENIMGGARLLQELLDAHHNDLPLVLAAYNAGPAAVARYGGVPPFHETQGYVRRIIDLIADARPAGADARGPSWVRDTGAPR